MTIIRKLSFASAIFEVIGSGVAAAADAPSVSAQKTSASRYSPVLIPGTGIRKGDPLPQGAWLVYRDITIWPKQEVTISLRAPTGKTIRALAERDMSRGVGMSVRDKQVHGRRHVDIRMYARTIDAEFTQRVYALVR